MNLSAQKSRHPGEVRLQIGTYSAGHGRSGWVCGTQSDSSSRPLVAFARNRSNRPIELEAVTSPFMPCLIPSAGSASVLGSLDVFRLCPTSKNSK